MNEMDIAASFWEHAEELRRTLIRIIVVVIIGICCALYFYHEVFTVLTYPLKYAGYESHPQLVHQEIKRERIYNPGPKDAAFNIPKGATPIIAPNLSQLSSETYMIPVGSYLEFERKLPLHELVIFGPVDGMIATLKISFWVGLVGTSPIWMFLALRFVAPALRAQERWLILPFLLFSLLFIGFGILFAFYVTIPLGNQYLQAFNTSIGSNLWSLSNYLDYTVTLLLANGLAFELCVILLFLVHYRIVSADALASKRRYMIVLAFIIGALLTPPDVLTQFMLAIPLIALYELAILYARIIAVRSLKSEASRSWKQRP